MSKEFPKDMKGFHPFGELIGFQFTKARKGYSQCVLDVDEKLFNPHGVLHGGVLYAMADTGMGGALYALLDKEELCATIEVKINYFKVVKSGNVTCDTKVVNKGNKVAVMESELLNNGVLVAKALGTYSIFNIKK